MGRKPGFERETALLQALKAFWWDGYDKTSLEDLLRAMDIQTSSFYNSFVSKEALFFEALQYYRQNFGSKRLSILAAPDTSGKEALEKYFNHLLYREGDHEFPSGCFMMKTAANLTDPDSNVGKEVGISINNLEKGFAAAVARGQERKEFSKHMDAGAAAKLLIGAAYGISVLTRTKKTKKELLSTASTLIELLAIK